MSNLKTYGKKILTLVANSPLIEHKEQFRDSRRGNRALMQRMRWLKNLNEHVNWGKYPVSPKFLNKLKVTILHN